MHSEGRVREGACMYGAEGGPRLPSDPVEVARSWKPSGRDWLLLLVVGLLLLFASSADGVAIAAFVEAPR